MDDQWINPSARKPGRGIFAMVLLLVLAVCAYVFLFRVNRFSLELEVIGEQGMILEYGEAYREEGVRPVIRGTLILRGGWEPELSVTTEGVIDGQKLGRQKILYSASYRGLQAAAERTVRVVDTQCPVITLHSAPGGTDSIPYVEEGYIAYDNRDGDITHKVLRVEQLGLVTYTVLDSSGNPGYAQREIPEYDVLPPELTLEGDPDVTITAGTVYEDPGCRGWDNLDGDISQRITAEGEVIWYRKGTYTITYSATDSHGNTATVQRRIQVLPRDRTEVVNPGNRVIYLTFDDGPGPYTMELLELLDSYDVQATFFVMDNGYYDVLREITSRGHSIGVHTMTHSYRRIYASPENFFADLYGMQDIIEEQTGVKTWLMRFPGGSSNTVSRFNPGIMTTLTAAVEEAGFHYFDWNVDSNDAGGAQKAQTVFQNVISGVQKQNVSVVLQHDVQRFSVDAVEDILIWGFENGYTFLPLSESSPAVHHDVRN